MDGNQIPVNTAAISLHTYHLNPWVAGPHHRPRGSHQQGPPAVASHILSLGQPSTPVRPHSPPFTPARRPAEAPRAMPRPPPPPSIRRPCQMCCLDARDVSTLKWEVRGLPWDVCMLGECDQEWYTGGVRGEGDLT